MNLSPRVCLSISTEGATPGELQPLGEIVLELDIEKAPLSTENFLSYVRKGFYDGKIFHRVIPRFMIQAGGFDAKMSQTGTGDPIQNEGQNGLKNEKYTVALARTSDPHSATSQFFINVADNAFLDHKSPSMQGWGYAVFGKALEASYATIDKIAAVKTGRSGFHDDVPKQAIVITKAEILKPIA